MDARGNDPSASLVNRQTHTDKQTRWQRVWLSWAKNADQRRPVGQCGYGKRTLLFVQTARI